MKKKTRLGSITDVESNLQLAQRKLGEISYLSFKATPSYNVKKGFVAVITSKALFPTVVLLRSRGSFLELRVDEQTFLTPMVNYLRKGLWVPLFIGSPLPYSKDLGIHVHYDEQTELDTLLTKARLS